MVAFYTLKVPLGQAFYEKDPHVDLNPPPGGAWEDIDVSAHVPIGATAAILNCRATESGRFFGLRKKGSTDELYQNMRYGHQWWIVGLDDNRVFQMKRQLATSAGAILVGYCGEGVIMLTNSPHNFVNTINSTWQEKDLSSYCPGAIGILLEVHATENRSFGVRKAGSTDSLTGAIDKNAHILIMVGCDENQKIDTWSSDIAALHYHVIGYVTSGAYFYTNAVNQSLTIADDDWHDLPAELHDQAVFGFFLVRGNGNYDIRKKGGEAQTYDLNQHYWAYVPCDTDKKCEGKISTLSVDFLQIGFGTAAT
ncbi:hypothetical protein ES703_84508 [subsurface metagenome]